MLNLVKTDSNFWATVITIAQQFVVIGNATTFLGLVLGGFLVWWQGTSRAQRTITAQNAAAYQALKDGLEAATKRGDAEKARADQQAEYAAALEIKNHELLQSAVADQTRYLAATKTLSQRILDLERRLGE